MYIANVEKQTGLPAKAIRYYESRGLITVKRRSNGYRDYDDQCVKRLSDIRLLRMLGISVSDIRLWCDGVITRDELIRKRLHSLDDDSRKSSEIRELCETLLRDENEYIADIEKGFTEHYSTDEQPEGALLLGIDIGTTSISAQVISAEKGESVQSYGFDHGCAIGEGMPPDAFAQDAERLIKRAVALIESLVSTYPGICAIGVAGQMHGITCIDIDGNILSPFYTWQNGFGSRVTESGLTVCGEIEKRCGKIIPTGYGLTTYYALGMMGMLPESTAKIVNISDLLVSRLCGDTPCTHHTNAAALGGYDLLKGAFDEALLAKLKIDSSLLPTVVGDYSIVGNYKTGEKSIPVAAAIGDNQAGVFGSVADDRNALLNVGTSSQISRVTNNPSYSDAAGELRPYFDGNRLISGAALCGGIVYAMLKDLVRSVLENFGCEVSDGRIYSYLNESAEKCGKSNIQADTRFGGTRADPSLRGSFTGIGTGDLTIEQLSSSITCGIVDELYELYVRMCCKDESSGIVVSGNAMRKNPNLRKTAAERFGVQPLIPCHTEEAAYGAALYAGISAGIITRAQSREFIKYKTTE